jgi:hypothetical protein
VKIRSYVPTYIAPGVDEAAYPAAMAMLPTLEFAVTSRPISMRATLTGYRSLATVEGKAETFLATGLGVRPATEADVLPAVVPAALLSGVAGRGERGHARPLRG